MMEEKGEIQMILPCLCPHCGGEIIVKLDMVPPMAEIMKKDEVSDDIKNIIKENNVTPEEDTSL